MRQSNENNPKPIRIIFETEMPPNVRTADQAAAVLKCKFQKELDEFLGLHSDLFDKKQEDDKY